MKELLALINIPKQNGDFGIEVEVEGDNLPVVDNIFWKNSKDGSLRNGMEYIFTSPRRLKDIPVLLNRLDKLFKENNSKLSFSFRTSIHVHVNVQKLSYVQVLNLIYTYLLLETPLMSFCGENRKANRFCLQLEDAEGAMDVLNMLFSGKEQDILNIPHDGMRYAAINVEALRKYGSIEFRAMQGTMDIERIFLWCNALNKLRDFAIKQESPASIYDLYIKKEAKEFLDIVLEETAPSFYCEDMVRSIQKSFSLSLDLPFAYVAGSKKKEVKEFPRDIIKEDIGIVPAPLRGGRIRIIDDGILEVA